MTEVGTTTLRHNPLNAVTANVERVTYADGRTAVRKELRRPSDSSGPWAASTEPRHWNYWRRELEVYRDDELRDQLADAGLVLPAAEVDERPDSAVLLMDDIAGTPGTHFSLAEHAALARACGRWQARPAPERPWTSTGFLRDYSTTRDVPWQLMTDDAAWRQPLIRETWPAELREAWTGLLVHRDALLDLVATLPRARCHLDFWVSNVIQRPTGELALFDWSFLGDGALGEDIGNYIPDAVFDLFWPAERLPELAETCIANYLDGLHEAGWRGDPDQVRLAVMASGVKYAWLLPGLLGRAADTTHNAYHRQVDSRYLFHQRGQALLFVADWCAEALSRARR
ncbi:aminoglycoside phosphotransferase [Kribbella speibonae]|uniref:Aminoglycoside phosphotransferase n=1 Tax=Kribbella speibonae TaxID=1572660 RepID=A0A4R0IVW9_9ACTN|nr:aminoglycoside phosphotransferase [Kribbella speibonae]TCC27399.1 aminoglycoside phosphotransferase [Kribbella speibonae]TCC35736.1 aminoglycoside phosphotransferase [Kribbella speibonae]